MEIEMYKINEGDDYVSLSEFFYENGLEVKPKIEKPDRVLKYWECKGTDGKLIAGGALETRDGKFVVADIAVDETYRGQGLGLRLMQIMDNEIKKREWQRGLACGEGVGFLQETRLEQRSQR